MSIDCPSAVVRVVVHARGALVTREVSLPAALPDGVVDLSVKGITTSAEAGSARATLEDSDRVVSAVGAALVVPKEEEHPGFTLARVRELAARVTRLNEEHATLSARRERLVRLELSPKVRGLDHPKGARDALDVRFREALAMGALLGAKVARLDERIDALGREVAEVSRALEVARVEDMQTSSAEREGEQRPTRTITARLVGAGKPGRLLLTYAVAAARWWPVYTLQMERGGAAARWIFDAIVAQMSGEDWSGAELALSSADLAFDARLPELASLRFGRAAPPRRRAFRPAPAGVDELFKGYLAFRGSVAPEALEKRTAARDAKRDEKRKERMRNELLSFTGEGPSSARFAPPLPALPPTSPPPPHRPPSAPVPREMMRKVASAGIARSGDPRLAAATFAAEGFAAPSGTGDAAPPAPPELVPSERWRDHDALVLAAADAPRRGRLIPRRDEADADDAAHALAALASLAPARAHDPVASRGMFDHRYEAAGRADIPSDGRPHRVSIGAATCEASLAWRTVPSEALEVYREARVTNPFDTALLGGPVDVYLDGELLAATSIDRIDRGGAFFCGLGPDERVKVARNVRASEENAGLLGGSTAVTHTVDIELSSSLGEPIAVTVLERVPVTDDKALEVKVVRANPSPAVYEQADRGTPIRGGRRFEVTVPPGQKATVALVYRLVFAQKLDIVGGSRRG